MAVQQGIAPRSGPRQHWVRRIGGTTNLVCSIIFAIMGGLSIGWLFSTLDFLGVYQPVLTVLASVGFTFFGFNQSRDLASRIYAKEPWKASLCGLVVYEFVEVSACLFEAAHGVRTMVWLSDFTGVVYDIFFVLLLVVLSVLPVFNIFCGLTDVRLHREKHGQSAPVVPPVQPSQSQLKPAAPGATSRNQPVGQGAPVSQFPTQPKSTVYGAASVNAPVSQGPLAYQSPTQPKPAAPGTAPGTQPSVRPRPVSGVDPNATVVYDLSDAQPLREVATDALETAQSPGDETLVMEQESGGGRPSGLPFSGRRRRE